MASSRGDHGDMLVVDLEVLPLFLVVSVDSGVTEELPLLLLTYPVTLASEEDHLVVFVRDGRVLLPGFGGSVVS